MKTYYIVTIVGLNYTQRNFNTEQQANEYLYIEMLEGKKGYVTVRTIK